MRFIKILKKYQAIIIIIALVIVSVTSVYMLKHRQSSRQDNQLRQAVFLVNNQVYFGYSKNYSDQMIELTEVYYLRTQDFLQPSNDQIEQDEKKKISLVKLGTEIHGPTDRMFINRDQVLFIEDMRDDSKINDAIKKYIVKNNGN